MIIWSAVSRIFLDVLWPQQKRTITRMMMMIMIVAGLSLSFISVFLLFPSPTPHTLVAAEGKESRRLIQIPLQRRRRALRREQMLRAGRNLKPVGGVYIYILKGSHMRFSVVFIDTYHRPKTRRLWLCRVPHLHAYLWHALDALSIFLTSLLARSLSKHIHTHIYIYSIFTTSRRNHVASRYAIPWNGSNW